VTVDFGADFDAGVLRIHANDQLWAKLCFEFSPQRQPMVVSVVTRGLSDDCNSVDIHGNVVYLRMAVTPQTVAFHYSQDGTDWHFVRFFSLGKLSAPQVGFSSQSPTGPGCRVVFSQIHYRAGVLKNNRSGE
jgi:regulation of enolase protein 1 (concanavalin A-like superfamily)